MEIVLQQYDHLDSTNEEAWRLISNGKAEEGMVLQACEQTQGRGAGKNRWESETGKSLTFSMIIRPSFMEPSQQFVLTEMISLALFDVIACRLRADDLSIKWPNDIRYRGKKLAGVLVQNRINGSLLDFSVIGVGLNVNQKVFVSDAPNPASLIHFSGKEENLSVLLDEILKKISHYYEEIKKDRNVLEGAYLQKLYRMGEWAEFEDKSGVFTGKITGIDMYGQLLLNDRLGNTRVYGFKEVKFTG